MRWLPIFWRSLVGITPHRQDVRDRFAALPALPEAERMTHRQKVGVRKPKSFKEWNDRHGRKRA